MKLCYGLFRAAPWLPMSTWAGLACALVFGVLGPQAVRAQPELTVATAVPVPIERVGRVASLSGAAQVWDSQDRQWIPVQLNRPITEGDRIRSEAQARVEVQVGTLGLWVGPSSDVELVRLDTQAAQVRVHQGHLVARVRTPEWARSLQLLTGEFLAHPLSPGLYRVDRDTIAGGRSAAAALRGLLSVQVSDARLQLAEGQRLEAMGAQAGGGLRSTVLLQDGFASWVQARDQAPDAPVSAAASPWSEVTGLEALERHGRWERHPDEGWIWAPQVVRPGWEPFRDGRWVWAHPWGWVWQDDAPWGFAPSYFGRWIQWNNRWVWSPGQVRSRPLPPVVVPGGVPEHRPVRPPGLDERPPRPERRHGIDRPMREWVLPEPAMERRGDRPLDRPVDRPFDRPVDRPVDRPADRPTDRGVDRPLDRPPPVLRPERGEPPRTVPRPPEHRSNERQPSDKPERADRQRQLAQ